MEDKISVRNIDPRTWREFRAEATRQGRNAGEVLNEIMLAYLKKVIDNPRKS